MLSSLPTGRARVLAAVLAVLVVVAGARLMAGSPAPAKRVSAVAPTSSTSTTTEVLDTTTVTEATTSTTPVTAPTTTATTRPPVTTTTTAARVKAAAVPAVTTPALPKVATTVRAATRRVPAARPALAAGGGVFRGLGTWVDVYDWTNTYTKDKPTVSLADIDHIADVGVQTLYIQAARGDTPEDVAEVDRLQPMIDRAKARGMAVVAWYLPYLTNPDEDMRHLRGIAALPNVDAIGVDIEAKNVSDVDERNRRLVALSAAVRQMAGTTPVAGIVLPPVVLDVINTNYWPNYPWHDIAPYYDVWMPMGYWTNRTQASGYRDAYRYTVENVERLREDLGRPDALVHAAGGIGDKTTADDIDGFVRAIADTGAIGGSIYDYRTTADGLYGRLGALRVQ